jgi:hypothetical protein
MRFGLNLFSFFPSKRHVHSGIFRAGTSVSQCARVQRLVAYSFPETDMDDSVRSGSGAALPNIRAKLGRDKKAHRGTFLQRYPGVHG